MFDIAQVLVFSIIIVIFIVFLIIIIIIISITTGSSGWSDERSGFVFGAHFFWV